MTSRRASGVPDPSARVRLLWAAGLGALIGLVTSLVSGTWQFGLLLGWMVGAALYVGWMWATMWPMPGNATHEHACREDPGQAAADMVVLGAAVASLGAVAVFLVGGSSGGSGKVAAAALTVLSVAFAWATVHTLYTARYAREYYVDSRGGIDFHEDSQPRYRDFAYLAFTVGMTFQVSDTDISRHDLRDTILRHMLLSYFLGAVVIAVTINLVAGLAK